MEHKTAWILLLVAAAIALPTGAFAQASTNNGTTATGGMTAAPVPCTIGSINAVNDVHSRSSQKTSHSQRVNVTDDNILLAIALRNNGAGDIPFTDLRNSVVTDTNSMSASQTAKLDRSDVFSALALGLHDGGGALEALACVSDLATAAQETKTQSQAVSLDQNTVLLAIALHNSGGSGLAFGDVVNVDTSSETTASHDQNVTVPRDNTFNALVLGAGGSAT